MQTWDSKPTISAKNNSSNAELTGAKSNPGSAGNSEPEHIQGSTVEAVSPQANLESRIEAGNPNHENKEGELKNEELEENEETILIRRVGFVFLAYNVEYWWVEQVSMHHSQELTTFLFRYWESVEMLRK